MALTTEALVARELNAPLTLDTVELAELRPDEALVEIHAAGICHTDLSCMSGVIPAEFPAVLGHEGAGVLLKVGSQLQNFSNGDKVLLSFTSCGDCSECRSDAPSYCDDWTRLNFGGRRNDGSQPVATTSGQKVFSSFFGQSSFSRLAVVSGRSLVQVPQETDLALFAPLGCGLQTGAGTVFNALDVRAGQSMVVFGVGAVGMAGIMAAKIREASPIVAVDINQERLDLAKQLGATHTVLSGRDVDAVAEVQKLCGGKGPARAMDCSGVPAVVEQMIRSLGTRGKAATVGAPAPGKCASVDIFSQLIRGAQYIGSCEGDSDPSKMIPYLIEQHKEGRFPVEKLVEYYDVKDHSKAFEDMHSGKVIKAVLRFK